MHEWTRGVLIMLPGLTCQRIGPARDPSEVTWFEVSLEVEGGAHKGASGVSEGTFHGGTSSEGRRNPQHHVSVGRSLGYRGWELEKPVDSFGLEGVNGLQQRNTLREGQVEPREWLRLRLAKPPTQFLNTANN